MKGLYNINVKLKAAKVIVATNRLIRKAFTTANKARRVSLEIKKFF